MAEEKKTPTSGQKPAADEAKKKAPARKAAAKSASAKAKPQAEKSAERKAAPKKAAGARKPAAKKEAAEPKAAPKRKPARKEPELVPLVVRASAKYVRVAPRKARLIADQVRGLHIDEARALLDFSPRHAARDIRKLIDSAAANAENNHDLVADEMRIAELTVDEGPTLRRFRARAMGRATRIDKRTSHIAVALTPEG